jgi:putative nucleotidyltransferase with HDIG domain
MAFSFVPGSPSRCNTMTEYKVKIDQLRVGVFIQLDLKWFAHPFLSNSFKITKPSMIETLRELGLKSVICIPEKSDVLPYPSKKETAPVPQPAESEPMNEEMKKLWEIKKERIEQLKKRRENIARCERRFESGVGMVKNVMRNIHTGSPESIETADELMRDLIESLMDDKESAVQLMNTELGSQNVFYHSLNVSVLSMILGREYELDPGQLRVLGLGALFHDIGKNRVPKNILTKTEPLNPSEASFLQLHPKFGMEIVSKTPSFPKESADIVLHHHERCDGKGYPDKLPGNKISVLTRIASITNVYDNYCNRLDPRDSLTPYEALSRMFAKERDAFDKELLALFIQCLGIYPPGTIVKLSNGLVGIVISVTPNNPLRPSIVVYDPSIPKDEALIYDLRDNPSLSIDRSIRPLHLDPEIFEYLNPRARITYYIADSESAATTAKNKTGSPN